jgi:glutamate--cysteine ligase
MRFVEAFLIYCLIEESPPLCDDSLNETKHNQAMTAKQGRDPDFKLQRDGGLVGLNVWAGEILDKVMPIAECIDRQEGCARYADAVRMMQGLIANPDETPSARVLEKLRSENCSFFELAFSMAEGHRDYFAAITPLSDARQAQFSREASESVVRQKAIETADNISLDEYLATYFSSES